MANIKSPAGDVGAPIGIRSPGIWSGIELRTAPGGGPPSLAVPEKEASAFQQRLQSDPAGALASMGVVITPEEARRVSQRVKELGATGGRGPQEAKMKVNGSIEVGVKMNIGK